MNKIDGIEKKWLHMIVPLIKGYIRAKVWVVWEWKEHR